MSQNPDLIGRYRPYTLDEVRRNGQKGLFTVVSTFAGGGGSSTGYKLAGGKVCFVNEVNPTAAEGYRLNYPETPVENVDIRKITRNGKGREGVLNIFQKYGIELGELDIFDGSPPCTTFSQASAGRGREKTDRLNVVHAGVDQSRIGMLVHDYVYLVNCIKPRVFVMENVVPSKNSPIFKDALDRVRKHGYLINWKTLVSSDLGVPQKRTRLVTIGIRPDIAKKIGLKTHDDVLSVFPDETTEPISVRKALDGLRIDPEEEEALLHSCYLSSSYEVLRQLPKNQAGTCKIGEVHPEWVERFNSEFTLIRAGWDEPSPTLTCRGQQMGISGVHHPDFDRKFSIDELKRLMSLPDDFHLTGTFNQKAERIGNMVPPLMMSSIATSIYEKVLSYNN